MLSVGGVASTVSHRGSPPGVIAVFFVVVASSPERSYVPEVVVGLRVVHKPGERAGYLLRLMVDYVMTVAVSISSAVANIASAPSASRQTGSHRRCGLIVIAR